MKLLLDTNILLDCMMGRQPFAADAGAAVQQPCTAARIGQIRGVADDEVAARRVYFQKLHPYHPVPSICPARGFQKAGEREKNARASVYAASFCSADTPF